MVDRHMVLAAKGGGMVFAGRLFVWGSRFGMAVLLARALGADQYGLYNITLTIATLGSAFAVIGLDSALIRYVAVFSRRGDRQGLLGTLRVGIGLPMLVSGAAAAILLLLAGPIARLAGDVRLEPLIRIGAVLVPAMVSNSLLAATLQGAQRIGWAVLAEQFAQPTVRLAILLVLVVIFRLTPEGALVASTLATLAATALLMWFVQRQVSLTGVTGPVRSEPGTMLRFSLPVYFSNLVNTFGGNLQTLLLGAMASVAKAGIFGIANQVMLVGAIFHSAVVQAAMPIFAELQDSEDRGRLNALYRTTSKWTFTLNVPFFLLAVLMPEALLSIFGPDFTSGAPALTILAFASLTNAATGTSGAVLDMTGHTSVKLVNTTLSVGLAIALNLLLIPSMGVTGAAIASFGSVASVNLLRVAEVAWLVRVAPYDRSWLKPLVAGAAAAAVGWLVVLGLHGVAGLLERSVLAALALAVTYVLVLVLLRLSDDDRIIVSRAARKLTRRRADPRGMASASATHEPT